MQMKSSSIKKLNDYIKFLSKNLCFVDSATLCSKSVGILRPYRSLGNVKKLTNDDSTICIKSLF